MHFKWGCLGVAPIESAIYFAMQRLHSAIAKSDAVFLIDSNYRKSGGISLDRKVNLRYVR